MFVKEILKNGEKNLWKPHIYADAVILIIYAQINRGGNKKRPFRSVYLLVPVRRLEHPTHALRMRCSTN